MINISFVRSLHSLSFFNAFTAQYVKLAKYGKVPFCVKNDFLHFKCSIFKIASIAAHLRTFRFKNESC